MAEIRPVAAGVAVGEALRALTARFAAAAIDTPSLDARLLLEAATGWPREVFVTTPERRIGPEQAAVLERYAVRRLTHEPVTRILGVRQFWGREFEVTPDTLDPRADSETLIEAVLGVARPHARRAGGPPRRILDIGTGTGCLLLTLLAELPGATGTGIDISGRALAVARRNAVRLGLAARASWVEADALGGSLARAIGGDEPPFDLVVANPPYIPSREIAGLAPEVRLFDPRLALDGGDDGLDFYRALTCFAGAWPPHSRGLHGVAEGAWVFVEVGAGQADAVVELARAGLGANTAWDGRTFVDLGGHTRCVAWRTRS